MPLWQPSSNDFSGQIAAQLVYYEFKKRIKKVEKIPLQKPANSPLSGQMLTKAQLKNDLQKTFDMLFAICDSYTHTETTLQQNSTL